MKLTKIAAALLVALFATTSCGTLVLTDTNPAPKPKTTTVVVQNKKEVRAQKKVTRQTEKQAKKDAKAQQKQQHSR